MKKGSLFSSWPEYFFILFLIVGYLLMYAIHNQFLMYLIIFLCGFATGMFIFARRKRMKFPMALIIVGFTIGIIIGSKHLGMSWLSLIIVYAFGAGVSYFMKEQNMLPR